MYPRNPQNKCLEVRAAYVAILWTTVLLLASAKATTPFTSNAYAQPPFNCNTCTPNNTVCSGTGCEPDEELGISYYSAGTSITEYTCEQGGANATDACNSHTLAACRAWFDCTDVACQTCGSTSSAVETSHTACDQDGINCYDPPGS
jgi:hypothetical protein